MHTAAATNLCSLRSILLAKRDKRLEWSGPFSPELATEIHMLGQCTLMHQQSCDVLEIKKYSENATKNMFDDLCFLVSS